MNNSTSTFAGNINLSALHKKRFTIDGDESLILELNTSDLLVPSRLDEAYPKLVELGNKISSLGNDETNADEIGAVMKETDAEMRKWIDYIFDSNVSEVCAPIGSMYDPLDGQLRYEIIINALIPLYEDNLAKEASRVQSRVASHTDKYTK